VVYTSLLCLSVPGFIGDSGLPLLARVPDIVTLLTTVLCSFRSFSASLMSIRRPCVGSGKEEKGVKRGAKGCRKV